MRIKTLKALFIIVVLATILLGIYWAILPNDSPSWTGFGSFDEKVMGPRAKTLWDWMELLIVPFVLAIGVWWLNISEKSTERDLAQKRDNTEREIAAERQWQSTLESYFDRMTDLMLDKNLYSKPQAEVLSIARTRTLAVLRNLNSSRKGQVLQFLYEANLLGQNKNTLLDLSGADLSNADLRGANLSKAIFKNIQLANANLSQANFAQSNMTQARLTNANLRNADLRGAILVGADLTGADLTSAHLDKADLRNAILNTANLESADFVEANLHQAKLNHANISDASFYKANLMIAELMTVKMNHGQRAYFQEANMMGCNLVNADLSRSDLNNVNMMGANLLGATLTRTNLQGADLREIALDSLDNFRDVKSLDKATLPDRTVFDGRVNLSKITSPQIIRSLNAIRKMGFYRFNEPASEYDVLYKGRYYDLDDVITLAFDCGDNLPHDIFDKKDAIEHLTRLGFTVSRQEIGGI